MPGSINKLWIAIGLPAILAAAIGATVAFAQDDAPTATGEGSTPLQQEPTPSPTPDPTTPEGDDTDDGTTPEKDCPRHDGSGGMDGKTPSSGSTTGISFRRH